LVAGTPENPSKYVPKRGDAVWFEFDPQVGHEQAGRRPVLVLSSVKYNGPTGLAIVCPITTQQKGSPFEVQVPAGYAISGVILADQVKNTDWKMREARFICKLPDELVEEVIFSF
jgi:mRNA interferase MazF